MEQQTTQFVLFAAGLAILVYAIGGVIESIRGKASWLGRVVIPCLVALVITWVYFGSPLPTFRTSTALPPLGTWVADRDIKYQYYQFGSTEDARVPVLECSEYSQSERMQEEILPPLDTLFPIPKSTRERTAMDPHVLRELMTKKEEIVLARERGRKRCALNPEEEWLTLDTRMSHLTGTHAPSLGQTMRSTPHSATLLTQGHVSDILIGRDFERYLRVLAVQPVAGTTEGTKKIHTNALGFYIIKEQTLLEAATDYLREFYEKAEVETRSPPCLCVAYFGIVGSGLHLHYHGKEFTTAELDSLDPGVLIAMRNQRAADWQLWVDARVKHHNMATPIVESNHTYVTYMPWPYAVHQKLNVSRDRYPNVTSLEHRLVSVIEYYQLEHLLSDEVGRLRVAELDEDWLLDEYPVDEEEDDTAFIPTAPLVQAFPLENFEKNTRMEMTLSDKSNACFQRCLAVEATIAKHARE